MEITSEPSMEHLTTEYLNKFTKEQLRKYSRKIGLKSVWANKVQLVEMIMDKHNEGAASPCSTSHSNENDSIASPTNESESDNESEVHPSLELNCATPQDSDNNSVSPSESDSNPGNEQQDSVVYRKQLECELNNLRKLLQVLTHKIEHSNEEIKKMSASFIHLNTRVNRLEGNVSQDQCDASTEDRNTVSIRSLSQRVSDLEGRASDNTQASGNTSIVSQTTQPSHVPLVKKHLILGDVNIRNIQVADLSQSWRVRTLAESNYDLMTCWVKEKLLWSPATCIIYGGLFDILEGSEYTVALDNLGTLISELKTKNENMNIYISQLVPTLQSDTLQAKINDFNEHLQKWGDENEIPIINPQPHFKLGNGNIDENCYYAYGQHQGSILIRLGATRLLQAMADQCPSLQGHINKENIKKHLHTHYLLNHPNKQTQGTPGHPPFPSPPTQQTDGDGWRTVGRHTYAPPPSDKQLNPLHPHPRHHRINGRWTRDPHPPSHSQHHRGYGGRDSDLPPPCLTPGDMRGADPPYSTSPRPPRPRATPNITWAKEGETETCTHMVSRPTT